MGELIALAVVLFFTLLASSMVLFFVFIISLIVLFVFKNSYKAEIPNDLGKVAKNLVGNRSVGGYGSSRPVGGSRPMGGPGGSRPMGSPGGSRPMGSPGGSRPMSSPGGSRPVGGAVGSRAMGVASRPVPNPDRLRYLPNKNRHPMSEQVGKSPASPPGTPGNGLPREEITESNDDK